MRALRISLCLALLVGTATSTLAQPSFRGTGVEQPNYTNLVSARIADDGCTATFTARVDDRLRAYRWTEEEGASLLPLPPASLRKHPSSYSTGISADGSRIVGRALTASEDIACVWIDDSEPVALAGSVHPFHDWYQYAISADGTTIVGTQDSRPTLWTSPSEPMSLSMPPGSPNGQAWDVSGDGSVVVGTYIRHGKQRAFRWTQGRGTVDLSDLEGDDRPSSAWAVSRDGTTVLGSVSAGNSGSSVKWIAGQGMTVIDGGAPFELSADGLTIVGMALAPGRIPGHEASIWDQSGQARPLAERLRGIGVAGLDDWHLLWADDVSADGQNIIGIGRNPTGRYEYWVARIGPVCPGDVDASGTVELVDLTTLLSNFGTSSNGTPSIGDFDDDGAVGVEDLLILLAHFGMPCS